MNTKHIALWVWLVLGTQLLFAQNNIHGKIINSKDQTPVENVNVYITELRRSTISNVKGEFSFDDLPSTSLYIQFTSVGYKSEVKLISPYDSSSIVVILERSATELGEVLITGSNTKLSEKTPYSVNSISINEIRKHASPSLMGNLSYEPGVDKITIGNGIGKPVIRGLSFNRILLYSQGTRIENQQWDDHHDLGLTDVGVEHVEIVRGPAALIYGANTMGGALIFTDEKPAPAGTTFGDVNLGLASNTLGVNLDAGIRSTFKNGFFYGIRVGVNSQTSYLQGEDESGDSGSEEEEEFAPNSKFMNTTGKANFGWSKRWGVSKLSYSYLNQQIGIIEDESGMLQAENEDEEQRDRGMEAPYQDVSSHIISSENTVFTGQSKVQFNLAWQSNQRKEYEPLENKEKELAIGLDLNAITYDVKWVSNESKQFGVTLGSQGTVLKNENNGMESLVPDADVSDFAAFSLFRYDIKKFNFLCGIRVNQLSMEAESYEKYKEFEADTFILLNSNDTISEQETELETEYTPISFSAGFAFYVTKNLILKANAASGYSAPNYAQLGTFGKHEGTYRFERGNPNLKMEQSLEVDIGLIWNSDFISVDASFYYNKVHDYIYIANTGDSIIRISPTHHDTLPLYDYRQADTRLSGAEFGFEIHPATLKWLFFKTAYSFLDGELDSGGNLPYLASNKLIFELRLVKTKLWKINDASFSFVASNFAKRNDVAEYELSSDGYTLFDATIGGKFKVGQQQLAVNLFCTNLLNTGYYNQLSLVKYIGVRDMGRNIGIQVHIPIGLTKNAG